MTNKTVRPIMTMEALDALNRFHQSTGLERRSESIMVLASIVNEHQFLTRENTRISGECFILSVEKGRAEEKLSKSNEKLKQWKLIAWSMTVACVALVATMMITAS